MMSMSTRGRILAATCLLALAVSSGLAEAARGGRGNGGGDNGGGDGNRGTNKVLECLGGDCTPRAAKPPCTSNYCGEITYTIKKEGCEIRTCQITHSIRKCTVELDDIRVCVRKLS
jgi:hypothetical protein